MRARSLEQALEALAVPDSKALAGGQSLLPAMKLRIARPSRLVDIGGLGLGEVTVRDGELGIGALATWDELSAAEALRRPAFAAVAECAASIGDLQVRNLGTIGGSLAHADPASDMPAVVLALRGHLTVRSATGERDLAAESLFEGPFLTTLGVGDLITEIAFPSPPAGSGSAYVAVEHPASGFALAGAAALVGPDGSASVALTGIAGTPFLADGDPEQAISQADVFGDPFAPADYRRQLARAVTQRAIERAESRAKEDATWRA